MTYFKNNTEDLVDEALNGLMTLSANKHLRRVDGTFGLYCDNPHRKVKIVIGGGSGHEPLFAGMVGPGMADGAVLGHIFAAPSPIAIVKTVQKMVRNEAKVLFLYGNYSGDVLNFDIAQEDLDEIGMLSDVVRIHDDITSSPLSDMEGRRGIAGGIFVMKVAAAAADAGMDLEDVKRIAENANFATRSIGVAMGAADSITDGLPMFTIPDGHVEIGMGIHGEKGVHQGEFKDANKLVEDLFSRLMEDFQSTGIDVRDVVVLINGLGRTTLLEQLIVVNQLRTLLSSRNIRLAYIDAGEFATSLNMQGFSITMMHLDDELNELFFKPAASFGFSIR